LNTITRSPRSSTITLSVSSCRERWHRVLECMAGFKDDTYGCSRRQAQCTHILPNKPQPDTCNAVQDANTSSLCSCWQCSPLPFPPSQCARNVMSPKCAPLRPLPCVALPLPCGCACAVYTPPPPLSHLAADPLVGCRHEAKGLVQVCHGTVKGHQELVAQVIRITQVPTAAALFQAATVACTERSTQAAWCVCACVRQGICCWCFR